MLGAQIKGLQLQTSSPDLFNTWALQMPLGVWICRAQGQHWPDILWLQWVDVDFNSDWILHMKCSWLSTDQLWYQTMNPLWFSVFFRMSKQIVGCNSLSSALQEPAKPMACSPATAHPWAAAGAARATASRVASGRPTMRTRGIRASKSSPPTPLKSCWRRPWRRDEGWWSEADFRFFFFKVLWSNISIYCSWYKMI